MSEIFFIASSVITIVFLVVYFAQVRNGSSTPNPSTWLIWAIVSVMNAISFFLVSGENIWQSLYVLLIAVGLVSIFVYAIVKGRFGRIGILEWVIALLALLIGVIWKTTGNADVANLSLQVIFLMSIVPTIVGLLRNELREKGLPWYLAVTSHALVVIGILVSGSFRWVELTYPLVTGVIGNGIVALVIFTKNQKRIQ